MPPSNAARVVCLPVCPIKRNNMRLDLAEGAPQS